MRPPHLPTRFRPRCESLEDRAVPAAGDLDLSFNSTGYAVTPVGTSGQANDLAVQLDGKIVTVGGSQSGPGVGLDFAVVRYRPDGTLDPTFGTGGRVTTNFGKSHDMANAVAIQTDGKIVVAGYANLGSSSSSNEAFALARYNTNGTLDMSFGNKGLVRTELVKSATIERLNDVVIQSDGKIVVVGQSQVSMAIARYTTAGQLDKSFDGDGFLVVPSTEVGDILHAVALQADGRIVAAGQHSHFGDNTGDLLVRFGASGGIDSTFGNKGTVVVPFHDGYATVAVRSNGKIVAGGRDGGDRILAQVNADGSPDLTFGGDYNGDTIPDGYSAISDGGVIFDLAVDPAGRTVAAGRVVTTPGGKFHADLAVFRYTPAGLPDPTFGSGGVTLTDPGGTSGFWYSGVALQSDGRIVAAGPYLDAATSRTDFIVARYLSDDPPPAASIAPPWDFADPDADDPWDATAPYVG